MKKNYLNAFLIILIVGSVLFFLFHSPYEPNDTQSTPIEVQNTVINNAIQQYDIAKRQGDKIQIAVQAGLVSAAYLQANDELNYDKWKVIEREADKDAGLSTP